MRPGLPNRGLRAGGAERRRGGWAGRRGGGRRSRGGRERLEGVRHRNHQTPDLRRQGAVVAEQEAAHALRTRRIADVGQPGRGLGSDYQGVRPPQLVGDLAGGQWRGRLIEQAVQGLGARRKGPGSPGSRARPHSANGSRRAARCASTASARVRRSPRRCRDRPQSGSAPPPSRPRPAPEQRRPAARFEGIGDAGPGPVGRQRVEGPAPESSGDHGVEIAGPDQRVLDRLAFRLGQCLEGGLGRLEDPIGRGGPGRRRGLRSGLIRAGQRRTTWARRPIQTP